MHSQNLCRHAPHSQWRGGHAPRAASVLQPNGSHSQSQVCAISVETDTCLNENDKLSSIQENGDSCTTVPVPQQKLGKAPRVDGITVPIQAANNGHSQGKYPKKNDGCGTEHAQPIPSPQATPWSNRRTQVHRASESHLTFSNSRSAPHP